MVKNEIEDIYRKCFREAVTMSNLDFLAGRLSEIAGRERPWTGKFLHSILREHNGFAGYRSAPLELALRAMRHDIDGTGAQALMISNGVFTSTPLLPGTIIQGEPTRCSCGVWFIPRWGPQQKYHTKLCRRRAEYERRKEKRKLIKTKGVLQ